MAIVFGQVDGQVANTQVDTVTTVSNPTVIMSQSYHNTDSVSRLLQVWLHDGTNARKLHNVILAADATLIDDTKYILAASGKMQAQAAAATVIDYWISSADIS